MDIFRPKGTSLKSLSTLIETIPMQNFQYTIKDEVCDTDFKTQTSSLLNFISFLDFVYSKFFLSELIVFLKMEL